MEKGNIRANPFLYKIFGEGAPAKTATVLFIEDGAAGRHPSGNRSGVATTPCRGRGVRSRRRRATDDPCRGRGVLQAGLRTVDFHAGGYNRSNRSLHHMVENMAGPLAALWPCALVAPKATSACVCLWSVGRVAHQVGYADGYGKHGPGFALSLLAALCLEGICALTTTS